MELHLSKEEFRHLLDLVYIGNWILNATRGEDRLPDYDKLQQRMFSQALQEGMTVLGQVYQGSVFPSRAYVEGGIHHAIADYERQTFYDILAEDLAHRDMGDAEINGGNFQEFLDIMNEYLEEFYENGTDNLELPGC